MTGSMNANVVVVAGPSGSGKSHLAQKLGWNVLHLDDFYRDHDEPDLPASNLGITDWDDPRSWDQRRAMVAILQLCSTGDADVPVYDISLSRRTGTKNLSVSGNCFVAEGLFAPQIVAACQEAGVLADAICLTRSRWKTFLLRLVRDLRESRKPLTVLVRRGWQLLRAEPSVIASAVAAGCAPMAPREAYERLSSR